MNCVSSIEQDGGFGWKRIWIGSFSINFLLFARKFFSWRCFTKRSSRTPRRERFAFDGCSKSPSNRNGFHKLIKPKWAITCRKPFVGCSRRWVRLLLLPILMLSFVRVHSEDVLRYSPVYLWPARHPKLRASWRPTNRRSRILSASFSNGWASMYSLNSGRTAGELMKAAGSTNATDQTFSASCVICFGGTFGSRLNNSPSVQATGLLAVRYSACITFHRCLADKQKTFWFFTSSCYKSAFLFAKSIILSAPNKLAQVKNLGTNLREESSREIRLANAEKRNLWLPEQRQCRLLKRSTCSNWMIFR